jgi:hypothetical protein
MEKIFSALEECSKMKRTSLVRSDQKRIFGDYGEQVMATCAGVQVSRNRRGVLEECLTVLLSWRSCHNITGEY